MLAAFQAISVAQIDRSPVPFPGGGSRLPFPIPRGGRQGRTAPDENITTRTTGRLQKINEQSLTVDAEDGRTLEFTRSKTTKFYKDSKEIEASALKNGDRVTVESTEDQRGRLFARSVFLEAPLPDQEKTTSEKTTSTAPTTEAPRDPDDPGPPVLRRGTPEKRPAQAAEPEPETSPNAGDPYIDKARAAALTFSEGLPSYVCKEIMSRFVSTARPVDWRAQDVVSMEVVYEDGKESYRNLAIDNKPTTKNLEELDGAWSTGEFATTLLDLFSPSTEADFRYRGQSSVAGTQGRVYDFTVQQPQSHWVVKAPAQSVRPAYKGSVWIEPASGRVLRIEMQGVSIPAAFPFDTVESVVEYAQVRIGGQEFLLPTHAEGLICQRGTPNCSRNTIDFRNYHKYEAETNIEFNTSAAH